MYASLVAASCLAIVSCLAGELFARHFGDLPDKIAPDAYMTSLENFQMNTALKKLCLPLALASFGEAR
jgi:hypothetical protein